MKNLRNTLFVVIALGYYSCTTTSKFDIINQENSTAANHPSDEDYWPFSKTLSKHDPFISELVAKSNY